MSEANTLKEGVMTATWTWKPKEERVGEKKLKSESASVLLHGDATLRIQFHDHIVVSLWSAQTSLAGLYLPNPQISPPDFWRSLADEGNQWFAVRGEDYRMGFDFYSVTLEPHSPAHPILWLDIHDPNWRTKLAKAIKEQVLPDGNSIPELQNGDVVVDEQRCRFVFVDKRFVQTLNGGISRDSVAISEVHRNGEKIWQRTSGVNAEAK